jgi:hypothetical protein
MLAQPPIWLQGSAPVITVEPRGQIGFSAAMLTTARAQMIREQLLCTVLPTLMPAPVMAMSRFT